MKSAFFEVDNFPHNFGGLLWIKWITLQSNIWFVQVVQYIEKNGRRYGERAGAGE